MSRAPFPPPPPEGPMLGTPVRVTARPVVAAAKACACAACEEPPAAGARYCETCAALCVPALHEAHRRLREGTLATRPGAPPAARATSADAAADVALGEFVGSLIGSFVAALRQSPPRHRRRRLR